MGNSSKQIYDAETADGYTRFGSHCDKNVYDWARNALDPKLVEGSIVVDVGCGNGQQTFDHLLRQKAAKIVGVEASADMIAAIHPVQKEDPRIDIRQGDLTELLPRMKGLRADVVINLFNILCFSHPDIPFEHMHSPLHVGGKLIAVSNAFAPSNIKLDASQPSKGLPIDLHTIGASQPPVRGGMVFRQVLDLEQPVPLQDHVHTIGDFALALPEQRWAIESAIMFPPEGCTLIDPEDTHSEHSALHHEPRFESPHPVYSPRGEIRMQYIKLCLIAEKR